MSNVVIVDSACDLPDQILKSKSVAVLPLNVKFSDRECRDNFTAEERLKLINDGVVNINQDDQSAPATRDQIIEFLTKKVLPNYDFAMVQTVARSRSPQFDMWYEVNMSYSAHYRKYRTSKNTFTLRTTDSGTMFTGQGLMALNAIYLAKNNVAHRKLIDESKQFTHHIQSYSAPADLHYLRERGRQKGDRSISWLSANLGKALNISPIIYGGQNTTESVGKAKGQTNAINKIVDHAMACIDAGVKTPFISIAYAGPLKDLDDIDQLKRLRKKAKEHNVRLATSVSTLSTIINLGPGNFSLAVAPNDANFKISA